MKHSKTRNNHELQHLRENLTALLKDHHLLPAELAAKTIIPVSTVTRILNGQVTNPGIDVVLSLAKGLGVTVSEILGDTPMGYATLTIQVTNRVGLLRDIARIIADQGVSVTNCFATVSGVRDRGRIVVGIEPTHSEQLEALTQQISQLKSVRKLQISQTSTAPSMIATTIGQMIGGRKTLPSHLQVIDGNKLEKLIHSDEQLPIKTQGAKLAS